jgi:hypothetical protein
MRVAWLGSMTVPPLDVVHAWCEAAESLGLELVAPYSAGQQVFVAWVAGFGSTRGTVIDWFASGNTTADLKAEGFYVSRINPDSYALFDRELVAATLDDWGWYGDPQHLPRGYTGRSWTE